MSDMHFLLMPSNRVLKVGMILKHFKGNRYKIIAFAKHTETLELLVVYESLEDSTVWIRPVLMFDDKVDTNKYPNVIQKYRFEIEV